MSLSEPRLFTIPSSVPFLPALVEALLAGRLIAGFPGSRDPMVLAQATLYLPTRRACRLAQDVFLDKLGGEAAILPRLVPIGDIDEDEIVFAEFAGGPLAGERLSLPRAMEPFERKAMLTQMILAWARTRKRDAELSLIANTPAAAFAMAGELARLQDDMITRGVDWKALDTLVPDEIDQHFAETLEFLKIVREVWPHRLAERQADGRGGAARCADRCGSRAAEARRRGSGDRCWLDRLDALDRKAACGHRELPNGAVVLPGLDTDLDEAAWQAIGGAAGVNPSPGHPQFSMQGFLRGLGVKRDRVESLEPPAASWPRASCVGGDAPGRSDRPAGATR